MSRLSTHPHARWTATNTPVASVATLLEQGHVVFLPELPFVVEPSEHHIFSPAILSSSKNTSYDPITDRVGGTSLTGVPRDQLRDVLRRLSWLLLSSPSFLLPLHEISTARSSTCRRRRWWPLPLPFQIDRE